MTGSLDVDVVWVADPAALDAALATVDAPVVGVDVERNDSHRYFRAPALIQLGVAGRCVLIDPLAMPELPQLDAFLAGRRTVLHALENDVVPLAVVGVETRDVEDTAIAASLLGLPTGLEPLSRSVLGIEADGDKERLQRSDWGMRPLTDEMVAYAAADVVHLPELWAALAERLDETGRRTWYEEEVAWRVQRSGDDDRRDWTRTKGAGRLGARARGVLRAVWAEREAIAKEHDLAPQRVVRDEVLIALAEDPPNDVEGLTRRGLRRASLRDFGVRLAEAVERGLVDPPERAPGASRRSTPTDRDAYDALRRARADVASALGIEAGVLCPSRPLWRAVLADPASGEEICELAELRPWQTSLLAAPLWEAYRRVLDDGA